MFNSNPKKFTPISGCDDGKWSSETKFSLDVERAGTTKTLEFNAVLVAAGRVPNVENMGLENAGVEFDLRKGVKVSDKLQSTNSNIYAVGDVASKYQFTHNSDAMARICVKNALFLGRQKYSSITLPWATYTEPEIAHVGLYPKEMEEQEIEFDTYKSDYHHNDRAICEETEGFIKIHTEKGGDKILGATIVGGPAGDMIYTITSAMYNKVGLKSIGACVCPYPIYSEGIKACTGQINGKKLTPGAKGALRQILKVTRK